MPSSPSTPRRSARNQKVSRSGETPTMSAPAEVAASEPLKMAVARSRSKPHIPTSLETILLSLYPVTLVVGSLFALIDPASRAAPYNAATHSHDASTAPSYFAKKDNIFNIFFVKKGWAWITTSYLFFLFTHPSTGTPWTREGTRRRLRGVTRHGLITLWWIFVTQWFFGPPLIDRGFTLTGGKCDLVEAAAKGEVDMDNGRVLVMGIACKAVGGKWKGGHDISGHVFLLVLGSMFLFEEVLHVTLKFSRGEERTIVMADGAVKGAEVETNRHADVFAETKGRWTFGAKFALGIATLSVYMLLMTAAYFHTWFEKLTGLVVALSGIFVVYILPRSVPALRAYVGLPGI